MDDRDDKKYDFLDSKLKVKNEIDEKTLEGENACAGEALTWDKLKFKREDQNLARREDKSTALEEKRTQIEEKRVELEAKNNEHSLEWSQEKFNLETTRSYALEESRVHSEALKSCMEVMENCRRDGMPLGEISNYLRLMFGE